MYKPNEQIQLTEQMELRFKEMEVYIIYDKLSNVLGHVRAIDLMVHLLNLDHEQRDIFDTFIHKYSQLKPNKKEITIYCRYYNRSYQEIRDAYGYSPNSISKYLKDFNEFKFTIYRRDNDTHDYNIYRHIHNLKKVFNISNEGLLDV